MKKCESRRIFLQKIGAVSLVAGTSSIIPATISGEQIPKSQKEELSWMKSLSPTNIFSVLDLDKPEMAEVRNALHSKGHNAALTALLTYYRNRYPKPSGLSRNVNTDKDIKIIGRADNLGKHIFQWGPYPPANYKTNID